MDAESGIFKTGASVYVKRLFSRYLSDKWYIFVLIVLPFIALSFVNLNFIYVALMAVFIVLPMLLGFVYVYYAFSEECVLSVRRSRVRIEDDGLEWIFYDDGDEVAGSRYYGFADICRCQTDGNYAELYLKGKGLRFLLLPLSEFSIEDRKILLRRLENLNR